MKKITVDQSKVLKIDCSIFFWPPGIGIQHFKYGYIFFFSIKYGYMYISHATNSATSTFSWVHRGRYGGLPIVSGGMSHCVFLLLTINEEFECKKQYTVQAKRNASAI